MYTKVSSAVRPLQLVAVFYPRVTWVEWVQIRRCYDIASQWLILELCLSEYSENLIFPCQILCSENDLEVGLNPVINMIWYAEK